MNNSHISKLNYVCLVKIFKQIKSKCERENPNSTDAIKYADLFRFATSFEWICEQLYNWNKDLYYTVGISQYDPTNSIINLGDLYCELQILTQEQQKEFFELSIMDLIKNTENIEASIIYTTNVYNENHGEFFENIINVLSKKRYLQYLEINMNEHTLENFPQFYNLKKLSLDVKINADELIECCKSNPNLECLTIKNNEMYGRLADIALDGNNLQYLTTLDFLMKPEIDAVEYAPLAGLPKLQKLTISGKHKTGSLKHLFSRLAEKGLLSSLSIEDADLNDDEIKPISLISSLSNLECGFIEPESIGHLTQSNNLSSIRITSKYDIPKILSEIWKLIKSIQHAITIHFQTVLIDYTKYNERLICIDGQWKQVNSRLKIECNILYSGVRLTLNDIPQMEYLLRYFPNTEIILEQYPSTCPSSLLS